MEFKINYRSYADFFIKLTVSHMHEQNLAKTYVGFVERVTVWCFIEFFNHVQLLKPPLKTH